MFQRSLTHNGQESSGPGGGSRREVGSGMKKSRGELSYFNFIRRLGIFKGERVEPAGRWGGTDLRMS